MEILEEEDISIPEVKQLLLNLGVKEYKHFQKLTLEYCNIFSMFEAEDAKKIIATLTEKYSLPRNISVQIVNTKPSSKTELINILQKVDFVFDENKLKEILDLLTSYVKE